MVFGPDDRPDLSGVPQDMMQGKAAAPLQGQVGSRQQFRSLVGIAVWLCAAMVIGLAVAFVVFRLPDQFGPVSPVPDATHSASMPQPAEPNEQVLEALDEYEDAMRDAAAASGEAQRQHAEARKAVEAARALAKNPESREAREAFDNAIREVQAQTQESQQ